MKYRLSIVIPVWNQEQLVIRALDSIPRRKDIQVIVVDDGSTDSSLNILKEYEAKDKRVTVLTQQNQGAGVARNAGLEVSHGEYLAFLDGDDYFKPDFLEKMYNRAKSNDTDIVICGAESYEINKKFYKDITWSLVISNIPKQDVFNAKDMPEKIFTSFQNWNWNKIFKRKFIEDNGIRFQQLHRTNDLYFTCTALVLAQKISVIQENLVVYRVGQSCNSQSTNVLYPLDFYYAFKELRLFLIHRNIYDIYKTSFLNWAVEGCVYNINSIKNKKIKQKIINKIFTDGLFELDLSSIKDVNFEKESILENFLQYNRELSFLKKLFSVQNIGRHRVICIAGIKFKFKSKIKINRTTLNKTFQQLFYKRLCKEFAEAYYTGKILRKNFTLEEWEKIMRWIKDYEKVNTCLQPLYNIRIPIVLACDKNYSSQMYVTILSALENKNYNTFYDFYLLVPERFSLTITEKFYDLQKIYKGCEIHFVEMNKAFASKNMQISHITYPTFYRLKMPEILPKSYKKAIYLDVDTIVVQDLTDYFNIDIADNYIAGVKAAGYILYAHIKKNYYDKIGIPDLSNYINAGVTLWNLEQIRLDSMDLKLLELAHNDYDSMDQDIINLAFQGRIKILPLKYNLMTKYTELFNADETIYEKFKNIYPKEEIIDAVNNPTVIHYADKIKPWNNSQSIMAEIWWKYALKSKLFKIKGVKRMPKVSVIIPVYNVEEYLRECLDSVVNQTLRDIEIICVDDGSTDSSLDILKEYAAKDNRFTILEQSNKGAGAARNKGLDIAKGEYLYFLDSDDYIDICCLEKLYNKITNENADICLCKRKVYNETLNTTQIDHQSLNFNMLPNKEVFSFLDIPDRIFQICIIGVFVKLYRKNLIDKNNIKFQEIKTTNDIFFNYAALLSAERITCINDALITYRQNRNNCLTLQRGSSLSCVKQAYNALISFCKQKNIFDLVVKYLIEILDIIKDLEGNYFDESNPESEPEIYKNTGQNSNESNGKTLKKNISVIFRKLIMEAKNDKFGEYKIKTIASKLFSYFGKNKKYYSKAIVAVNIILNIFETNKIDSKKYLKDLNDILNWLTKYKIAPKYYEIKGKLGTVDADLEYIELNSIKYSPYFNRIYCFIKNLFIHSFNCNFFVFS